MLWSSGVRVLVTSEHNLTHPLFLLTKPACDFQQYALLPNAHNEVTFSIVPRFYVLMRIWKIQPYMQCGDYPVWRNASTHGSFYSFLSVALQLTVMFAEYKPMFGQTACYIFDNFITDRTICNLVKQQWTRLFSKCSDTHFQVSVANHKSPCCTTCSLWRAETLSNVDCRSKRFDRGTFPNVNHTAFLSRQLTAINLYQSLKCCLFFF